MAALINICKTNSCPGWISRSSGSNKSSDGRRGLAEAAALRIASKNSDPLGRGLGRLTCPGDRRKGLQILDDGIADGARAHQLAVLLGVGLATLQRWRRQFGRVPLRGVKAEARIS